MITTQSAELWRLYRFYRQGILCLSGGVANQPNKYLEAMQVIENQVNSE